MLLRVVDMEKCIGCYECMMACSRRRGYISISKSAITVRTHGGLERGFVVIACHGCVDEDVPACARACPTGALTRRPGGGVKLDEEVCTGCGECVKACIIGAITWDSDREKPIICEHCGYCANYCPHGILKLVEPGRELI